jgi:hypothetical protein
MQDLHLNNISQLSVGLNTDTHPSLLKDGQYTNAINAKLNSHLGDTFIIQNEPANIKCAELPYDIIGSIKLHDGRFIIFTTDNLSSEIGILDECKYSKLINTPCLKFNKAHLIKGVSKYNINCNNIIYWTDGLNPIRYLNIDEIPYTYDIDDNECKTKIYTSVVNCEDMRIFGDIIYPNIELELNGDGELTNGAYQVAIAYTTNKVRVTDFMGVTAPVKIFNHNNLGYAIRATISNLDRKYDEYEVAVIFRQGGVIAVDRIGYYSTSQNTITISSVDSNNETGLLIEDLISVRPHYESAEDVAATLDYIFWANLISRQELNYQLDAMNITTKWVSYRVPTNYYKNGGVKLGYMRDEVYAFAIQWLYKTGQWSHAYHIPGRKALDGELNNTTGDDVIETEYEECKETYIPKVWETTNTATIDTVYTTNFNQCSEGILKDGKMAYWESSEKYPDNPYLYGEDSCTSIRHHRMPDSTVAHIYENDNDKIHPTLLGVQFNNIKFPDDPSIVGYRIVRSDRRGNKSVVGKGLLFNAGQYDDNGEKYIYPNYPYNDLNPDPFISTNKTKTNLKGEQGFSPLQSFSNTKFTFHSPSFSFNNPTFGQELKIESEEIAVVKGKFNEVYKHPKQKLLTNFAVSLAAALGALQATIAVTGNRCTTATTETKAEVTTGTQNLSVKGVTTKSEIASCNTLLTKKVAVKGKLIDRPTVLGVATAAVSFGFYFSQSTETLINIIYALTPYRQYAYQYNSHGEYKKYDLPVSGQIRRKINYAQYLIPGIQEVNNVKINNFERESSVYLELSRPLNPPRNHDNSRVTILSAGLCNNIESQVTTQATSLYGAIKRRIPNQYGQLNSISYLATTPIMVGGTSDIIFDGDVYISRFTVKRKLSYFNQRLFDLPNGFEFNYKNYYNIAYPRYWVNSESYDFQDLARLKLASVKHNLDCRKNDKSAFSVKDSYFYLTNNGVIDFMCESEYNSEFRDWDDTLNGKHYNPNVSTDLARLFRSDLHSYDNKYLYDRAYLKGVDENFISKQSSSFDPNKNCFYKYPNRVIYSLRETASRDNWLVYLPNNYHIFNTSNGNLTSIRNFADDRLIFLFDKSSPFVTVAVDTLQTDAGTKITLGDGGIFERQPQRLMYSDVGYGNCQTKHAWVNTPFGSIYPSQRQGRVFMFNGGNITEISRAGLEYWFKDNLPSKLLEQFPHYDKIDNPIEGIGVLSSYDNTEELYYLTKIDWRVKPELLHNTLYENGEFTYNGVVFKLGDPFLFDSASWTVSYSLKTSSWLSFHDWHPSFMIQTENHFLSYNGGTLWKHNDTCDAFCKFYDVDKPFEIEFVSNNKGSIAILSSLEWQVDAYRYFNDCYNPYRLPDYNFDDCIIYNPEQISGLLKLNKSPQTPLSPFPIYNANRVDVEYHKKEHKYRLNQFVDLTKDRNRNIEMFETQPNGYRKTLNRRYIDYGKSTYQRKRFRYNYNKIILRKNINDNIKMLFYFNLANNIKSPI